MLRLLALIIAIAAVITAFSDYNIGVLIFGVAMLIWGFDYRKKENRAISNVYFISGIVFIIGILIIELV